MIDSLTLDCLLFEAGMYTVTDRLNGSPVDHWYSTVEVNSLDTLYQWVYNQRRSYMEQLARHDLKLHVMSDDVYDFVLGKSAMLTEMHVNLRKVLNLIGDSND